MRVLGLKNCDTTRKAVKALREAGHDPDLVDLKTEPLGQADLSAILDRFGDAALNRASTTWRGLSEAERQEPVAELLARHPALLKRPVVTDGTTWTQGWKPEAQSRWI